MRKTKVRTLPIGKERLPVRWAVRAIIGLSLVGWAAIIVLFFLFRHSF